ncbi:MAG: UDP-2,3-diacylglucosamine hydrolase [Alphaproteobacteria bacterium]|nr:MAG: UDP-2,3-diacylglucosamine hydrolase [Alphaproteobacteria bacterium]
MNGSSLNNTKSDVKNYKTIFISDIHLGSKACQAELLLDFLKHNDSEKLYLVGDIVDGWRLKRKWYWPQSHNDVVQKILRKARKGTEIIYVPGNHDEGLRRYIGTHFGGIEVRPTDIYEAVNGDKYLVLHGDSFDNVMLYARWLAYVGDHAYDLVLRLNTVFNGLRRLMGLRYWSLSSYLKIKVKNAVQFISEFERVLANEAQKAGVQGVICGHIHHAEMKQYGDVIYMNDGDWVESCTALVEHFDGTWEIVFWADIVAKRGTNFDKDVADGTTEKPFVEAAE